MKTMGMTRPAFAVALSAVLAVMMSLAVFAEENPCGGAICYGGNGVLIEDSPFVDDQASVGGAIYFDGNGVLIEDSPFVDNHTSVGGAICFGTE